MGDYGMTFTEKWSTDNQLATTIELADKPLKGAKLTFDSTFSPQTGAKEGKLKTEYKQDLVTITADMDLNMAGPTLNASADAGHQGWLRGYQMAFNTSCQVGLGYQQKLHNGDQLNSGGS